MVNAERWMWGEHGIGKSQGESRGPGDGHDLKILRTLYFVPKHQEIFTALCLRRGVL